MTCGAWLLADAGSVLAHPLTITPCREHNPIWPWIVLRLAATEAAGEVRADPSTTFDCEWVPVLDALGDGLRDNNPLQILYCIE